MSTASIDIEIDAATQGDRVRTWERKLEEHLMGVECERGQTDLLASVKGYHVGDAAVVDSGFTRQTLRRTPDLIRRSTDEMMLIAFVRSGTHVIRQGKDAAVLEGEGTYVLDSSRPFDVNFASDIKQCTIHVPKTAVIKRIGFLDVLALRGETPLQKLTAAFAFGTLQSIGLLDAVTAEALIDQTLDLFALMLAQHRGGRIAPSTHRAGTLLRIKAYVKAHLRDDDLSLEGIGRALGVSTRYVNALLAIEGTSFGRYVLSKRLEGARREIMDPQRINRHVTEVALDWGFRDMSHFGRSFKKKFGVTPRDAKFARVDRVGPAT